MEPLEQGLYDVVSESLLDMSWLADHPVHPSIGLWSFFEAFKDFGVGVKIKDRTAYFTLCREVASQPYVFKTSLTFDHALRGWHVVPKGAPRRLYDAICMVYDQWGEGLPKKARMPWWEMRHTEVKLVRRKMDAHLREYFARYQEHCLVPVSGKVPELKTPSLFDRVLQDFPMHLLRQANWYRQTDDARIGPCADTMLDCDWDSFGDHYYPSVGTMEDFFWGHYLFALAKEKGYQTAYKGRELQQFLARGYNAFKPAYLVWEKDAPTRCPS